MSKRGFVVAAFPGTGKTHLCGNSSKNLVERECWKFDKTAFPENYINEIKKMTETSDAVFISTNKVVLDSLIRDGIEVVVVYPEEALKYHYLSRYRARGSHPDFISTITKYWSDWLAELDDRGDCVKYVLQRNQYIETIMPWLS